MPPGTERDIIILDKEPWAFRNEHALMNDESGRRDFFLPCIAKVDHCPACDEDDHDSAYIMFLSVMDLQSYTIQRGKNKGKQVPYSRKLMAVKSRQQGKFKRKYDALAAQGKNLRGLKVHLVRDDDRSPVIGNDIEFTGERYNEAQLERYKEQYEDRKGKQHINALGEALDYAELFPAMNAEEISAALGKQMAPTPGSDAESQAAAQDDVDGWDDQPAKDDNWDEPAKEEEAPASQTGTVRRAPASRAAGKPAATGRRVVRRAVRRATPAGQPTVDDYDDDIPF